MSHIRGLLVTLCVCLLGSGCTSPQPTPPAQPKSPVPLKNNEYVERLRQIFERLQQAEPTYGSTRTDRYSFELSDLERLCDDARIEKKKEIQKQMEEVEHASGKDSLRLVPLLVKLAVIAQDDPNRQSYLDQAITISETAARTGQTKDGASEAARSIAVYSDSIWRMRRAVPIDALRASKVVLELTLLTDGFTTEAVENLLKVGQLLAQQGKFLEAIEIVRLGKNYLSSVHSPAANAASMRINSQYSALLKSAGREKEAKDVDAQIEVERKNQTTRATALVDEQVEKALERAEVDPYGLTKAQAQAAVAHLAAGDKAEAYSWFEKALSTYKTLDTSDDELSRYLNDFAASWLAKVDRKAEEQMIIEKIIQLDEARAHKGNRYSPTLATIVDHYTQLHRYDDAISLLQRILEKRKQFQPPNETAVQEIFEALDRVYTASGKEDKSLEVRILSLYSAEAQYGKNDSRIIQPLLKLAEKYRDKNDIEQEKPLMLRTAALMLATNQFEDEISRIVEFYVKINQLAEADKFVQEGYKYSQTSPDSIRLSCLDQALQTLMEKYEKLEEFDKAECLLHAAMKNRPLETRWVRELSDLHLKHAAQLDRQGKTTESKKLLATSNAEYEQELNRLKQLRNNGASVCPADYEKSRQSDVTNLGLANVSSRSEKKSPRKK